MAKILKGTLDLLILRTLSLGPNHGLGIVRRIGQVTRGELEVKPGSLFPALYRLEERGWLASMPGGGGTHPRAKLYKLTQAGRKQIATETASWSRIAEAMARVIEETA
jgi:transcriptional regulator